jgi:hypothetical protein
LASRPVSDVRADGSMTPGRCTGYSVGDPAGEIPRVRLARSNALFTVSVGDQRGRRSGKWKEIDLADGGFGRAHCSALGVRAPEHLENSITSASIYKSSY